MTNQEADGLIEQAESHLRFQFKLEPIVLWTITGFLAVAGFISHLAIAWYAMLLISAAIGVGAWSLYRAELNHSALQEFERDKARQIWRHLVKTGVFGSPLVATARGLNEKIQYIYQVDPDARLLPQTQMIRLFDIYRRQRERRKAVDDKLCDLRTLHQKLSDREARLRQLGEARSVFGEIERFDAQIKPLENLRDEIANSYRRLENVITLAEQRLEAQHLHRELDELTAQLPYSTRSVEPAFAPESLEEIERQIGREIETYLQLERETEEHLR